MPLFLFKEHTMKIYIGVTASINPEGIQTPKSVTWEDGSVYEIDRILSAKERGFDICYRVLMYGREKVLFLDKDKRWFIEAPQDA